MRRLFFPALIVLISGLWACNDPGTERIPVPPAIQILEPSDDPDIPEYILGEDVQFIAQAEDGYDAPEELVVTWLTIYNDGGEQTLDLGNTSVDAAGRTTLIVDDLPVGAHTVRVTVMDTDDMTADDHVNVDVVEFDELPTVQITAPPDSQIVDEHDTVNFAATATDNQDTTLLDVEWTSDLHVAALDTTAPSANGAIQFQTDQLTAGEHVITITVTDGTGQEASDSIGLTVVAENLPPSMPAVSINPLGPDTTDDLECIASGSVDPEGGQVTYGFSWDLDGTPSGWSGQILTDNNTNTGDEWTCWATPSDPQGLSGDPGSATVIVGNTLPSYSSVVLTPTTAYEDTLLTCTPSGWYDPDGDPEGALYEWWIGAILIAPTAQTLDGTYFGHFDEVYCVVTPFDGNDVGIPLTSNIVTVLNTSPAEPVVSIDPAPPHTDQDLVCTISTPDPDLDGDTLSYEFVWYRDGVVEPTLVTDTVPAAETVMGEEWTCEVRADDGTDLSPWATAWAHVVPYPGDLVITELMVDPAIVPDEDGEWIEIYNTSPAAIPLDGFEITDGLADLHVINTAGQAFIQPGGYFVLGANDSPGANGGLTVDYEYDDIDLTEGTDEVTISLHGVVTDTVAYDFGGSFPAAVGASLTLDPLLFDAIDNDDGANWCGSTTPIFEWGDFGTPGGLNDDCDCWYSDGDLDGFGADPVACPPDYTDCDDSDPDVNPAAFDICWDGIDQDCDGADRECTCAESDNDADGYGITPDCPDIDCDDTNANIYPGAPETCNGVDDNCVAGIDEGFDVDGDGWTTCAGDCNDGNPNAYPTNLEVCDGGLDNDCNGIGDDEGADGCTDYYTDEDQDGYGTVVGACLCAPLPPLTSLVDTDCDDLNTAVHPFAPEVCNGQDDNCDNVIDEGFDNDNDGWTTCAGDCDDNDDERFPGNQETCDNKDNDCDAQTDEDENAIGCTEYYLDQDGDNYGITGDSECWCAPHNDYRGEFDGDCNDSDTSIYPGATEICNGLDNDCDGVPDDGVQFQDWYYDWDGDQHGAGAPANTCDGPPTIDWVAAGDDCDDADANNFPGNTESCDGADNDCDGLIDDGVAFQNWYFDGDQDGYGAGTPQYVCSGQPGNYWILQDGDCDDNDSNNFPNNNEICDFADNNCDGQVDEGYDTDNDGWSTCEGDCDDTRSDTYPGATETCNSIDDDCDGQTDEGNDNPGCTTYYRDLDGDGYGDAGDYQCLCNADVTNHYDSLNNTDCDDGAYSVNPGAAEVCNGIDDNCNAQIDEGIGNAGCTVYYRDYDSDTYGNPLVSQCLCNPDLFSGYDVTNPNDCYDFNNQAKPGQTTYFSAHRGDGNHDYNCDTLETKRWTDISGVCTLDFDLCDIASGWSGSSPSCGNSGTWNSGCYYSFWDFDCVWDSSTSRTQECR